MQLGRAGVGSNGSTWNALIKQGGNAVCCGQHICTFRVEFIYVCIYVFFFSYFLTHK